MFEKHLKTKTQRSCLIYEATGNVYARFFCSSKLNLHAEVQAQPPQREVVHTASVTK